MNDNNLLLSAEKEVINPTMDLSEKLQQEELTRVERVKKLTELTDKLFPGEKLADLRADVKRSFNVPQYGEHHNEGMLMDTHLALILENIEKIEKGEFPADIPVHVAQMMQQLVGKNKESLMKYALLHDISKADTMGVKYQDGTRKELTWEEWQAGLSDEEKSSPIALQKFCEKNGVSAITYYHKDAKHGNAGAEKLKKMEADLDVPPQFITAIDKHEVAYQFTKVGIKTYEKHFAISPEERDWALVASYIDTSSSLRADGKPDLKDFLNLLATIENIKIIGAMEQELVKEKSVDPKLVEQAIADLKKLEIKISESEEQLLQKMVLKCQFVLYDLVKLESNLQALVMTNQISEAVMKSILAAVESDGKLNEEKMKPIRGALKKANQLVVAALSDSKK